ncbi:MAG: hypothetical protein ABI347_07045 [Nitrososphaera sp.]
MDHRMEKAEAEALAGSLGVDAIMAKPVSAAAFAGLLGKKALLALMQTLPAAEAQAQSS